ncbi:MAG: PspC domain-containing protein [Firmicutes bacterium]|nr:PspC domain-containing protein [Bacillota bacterium]
MSSYRRLYRSTTNRMISGVCGGLADFFNVDPTVVRLAYVFLSIFTACFPGFLLYIIASLIIPNDPGYTDI